MNKPRILYVDDDKENLIVFESGLSFDFEIITTTETSEAHSIIESNNLEIILLDYKMPDITGIELADSLYQDFPDHIYIITSAFADMDIVIEAINHHKIFGFIPKPWNISELKLIINNAAKYHRTQNENKKLLKELKEKNEQLEIAIENEKNANALKTVFLKNMSHEIRTPLNAIIGFNQIAFDTITNEKAKNALNHSLNGCFDLLQVITNIITASKLISKQTKYQSNSVSPYELIESIISSKKLNGDLKIINKLPNNIFLESDYSAILDVVESIIDNALKFVRKGELTIYHEIRNDSIEIHFKDNGPGIDKKAQSLIFEPFRQEDESDIRKYNGNGLGLFIAYNHIKNLKGKFEVKSEKGKGADFIITFPKKYFTVENY